LARGRAEEDGEMPKPQGRAQRRSASVSVRGGGALYSLDDVLEETRAEPSLVKELQEYGVIKGESRAGTTYFDETEREIVRAVTELGLVEVGRAGARLALDDAVLLELLDQ